MKNGTILSFHSTHQQLFATILDIQRSATTWLVCWTRELHIHTNAPTIRFWAQVKVKIMNIDFQGKVLVHTRKNILLTPMAKQVLWFKKIILSNYICVLKSVIERWSEIFPGPSFWKADYTVEKRFTTVTITAASVDYVMTRWNS